MSDNIKNEDVIPCDNDGGEIEVDPFASLNSLFDENPEFKKTFDSLMDILGDDTVTEGESEVECVEIDGKDYIVAKTLKIAGNTYLYLVNENDVLDYLIQKVIIEDGEEYVTGLDSEKEFDLVYAYLQREFLMQVKEKTNKDTTAEQTDEPQNDAGDSQ